MTICCASADGWIKVGRVTRDNLTDDVTRIDICTPGRWLGDGGREMEDGFLDRCFLRHTTAPLVCMRMVNFNRNWLK